MTTIRNQILIDAPMGKIWNALSNIEELDKYDPAVKKSTATSPSKHGIGATRKVDLMDGKNWFQETCTVSEPNKSLTYELTNCSFPIHRLRHSYSFEKTDRGIKVVQVMEYDVKYGLFGKLMDALVIRSNSDKGIKKFFLGLKHYSEKS